MLKNYVQGHKCVIRTTCLVPTNSILEKSPVIGRLSTCLPSTEVDWLFGLLRYPVQTVASFDCVFPVTSFWDRSRILLIYHLLRCLTGCLVESMKVVVHLAMENFTDTMAEYFELSGCVLLVWFVSELCGCHDNALRACLGLYWSWYKKTIHFYFFCLENRLLMGTYHYPVKSYLDLESGQERNHVGKGCQYKERNRLLYNKVRLLLLSLSKSRVTLRSRLAYWEVDWGCGHECSKPFFPLVTFTFGLCGKRLLKVHQKLQQVQIAGCLPVVWY